MTSLRVGKRLRERVRREVRVWGLRAPARVAWVDGVRQVECEDPEDRLRALGFADAVAGMPALDLARRTWSGRLSELLGEREVVPGIRAPELDVLVRTLGFRREAERAYRAADAAPLDAYAAGINAWVDDARWEAHAFYATHGSRPRLWAPADSLLLHRAGAQVDSTGGLLLVSDAARPHWPRPWDARLRALWRALHGRELRAPGGLGAGMPDSLPPLAPAPARETPTLWSATILPGGDNHRIADGDGFRRLSAQRVDLTVRGCPVQRVWIRAARRGPLISDLLAGATDAVPPTGDGFLWAWDETAETAAVRAREPLDEPPVPSPATDVPVHRLIPLEGGR